MYNISLNDYIAPDILNIFTDASIKNRPNRKYSGCYGAAAVVYNEVIDEFCRIISDTTNNNAEIKGIRAGVYLALKYKGIFKTINIFSDSQISVFGLRDRIINWKLYDDVLVTKSGTEVKSQEIYFQIIHIILSNELSVNLYHQKGHVSNNYNDLVEAEHVFRSGNSVRGKIDLNFIRYISKWNNYIDVTTRNTLFNYDKSITYSDAIMYDPFKFDKRKYMKLINKKVR